VNKENAFMHKHDGLNKESHEAKSYVSKITRKRCKLKSRVD